MSALRYGTKSGNKSGGPLKPLEELTTFKPFNVRETRWEVWDVMESRYESYLNLHQ